MTIQRRGHSSPEQAAATVARTSYGRLLAIIAAASGDVAAAEDALADAFEQALTTWPLRGIPNNAEAWLLTVARNRERDRLRSAAHRTSVPLDDIFGAFARADRDAAEPDEIGDKRLALMFVCAHPAIDPLVRAPLMLQTVLGIDSARIAHAYAVPTQTMAQRLVRAKRRIRAAGIPFVVPDRHRLPDRLTDVLEAIYGTYAIEWKIAGHGTRDGLAAEALYLAETLAALTEAAPEAEGLAGLLCLSMSRADARIDSAGKLIPLEQQDTRLWDAELIAQGEYHLLRAHHAGRIGRFQLEAAIQSAHCARKATGETDLVALRILYDGLVAITPTAGASVSRAAVIGQTEGAQAGLDALDAIDRAVTARFQPAWATRAHLLTRVGRKSEARDAFLKAISLTTDPAERAYLNARSVELG